MDRGSQASDSPPHLDLLLGLPIVQTPWKLNCWGLHRPLPGAEGWAEEDGDGAGAKGKHLGRHQHSPSVSSGAQGHPPGAASSQGEELGEEQASVLPFDVDGVQPGLQNGS